MADGPAPPPLPYVLDRRAELGDQPFVQALLIGVSAYSHLIDGPEESAQAEEIGLGQLEAPAATAVKLYEWLLRADRERRLAYPLGAVTLLLAPSAAEMAYVARIVPGREWVTPTRKIVEQAVHRFHADIQASERAAAQSGKQPGMALYYFGGHGIDGDSGDPTIILEDVLAPDEPQLGANAMSQAEIRELLVTFASGDGGATAAAHRVRGVFICDCCREGVPRIQPLPFVDPLDTQPKYRDHCVLWATSPRLPATELTQVLEPFTGHELPLTALGHLVLTCIDWGFEENGDEASDLPLRLATTEFLQEVHARWVELCNILEDRGAPLPGKPLASTSGPEFSLSYSRDPPQARVRLVCEPGNLHRDLSIAIHRQGVRYDQAAPWTSHPESIKLVPGLFEAQFGTAGAALVREIKKTVKLTLTEQVWEFRRDRSEIRDP